MELRTDINGGDHSSNTFNEGPSLDDSPNIWSAKLRQLGDNDDTPLKRDSQGIYMAGPPIKGEETSISDRLVARSARKDD